MTVNSLKTSSLILLCFLFMLSCKEGEADTPVLAEMTITLQDSYTGSRGTVFPLSVTATDTEGNRITSPDLTWESSAPQIASVSGGVLTVQGNGSATISVVSGAIRAEKLIEITIIEDLVLFELDELSNQRQAAGGNSFDFLEEATMSAALIELSMGPASMNLGKSKDQVFYLAEGSIDASINNQASTIEAGGFLFLAAGTTAMIDEVTGNLKMIRVTLNKDFTQNGAPFSIFTPAQMEATRAAGQNVWNPFLNVRSIITGLYMLPQSQGGDGRLEHAFDEINIIVNGSSSFQTDKGTVSVKPGSVVFVRQGNGHLFNALNDDIDILILWNK